MLPDDRCIGGRQAAELELYSMRRKIANAKPKVDTHLDSGIARKLGGNWSKTRPASAGRSSVDKSARRSTNISQSLDFTYSETRETFKRIASADRRGKGKDGHHRKTGRLGTAPDTSGMAQRLSANRRCKLAVSDYTTMAHISNVVNMYRRMEQNHTLTERKKNHFDVSLYPTKIRRRRSEKAPATLVRTSLNPPTSAFSEYTTYRTADLSRPSMASKTVPKYRPASAPPLQPRRYSERLKEEKAEVPAHVKDIYDQLYSDLMEEIIEGRVYKEQPLKKLCRKFLLDHTGALEDVAARVVADVKEELDVED